MSSPITNEQAQAQNAGIQAQFKEFTQNPSGFLMRHRVNVPQEYMSNGHDAVQYLLNSGQMSQGQYNQIMQTAQRMGFKF